MDIQELNVSPEIRSAVEAMGFEELTEIQEKAIPVLMEGREVIAKAPTGTGKTCAFGIPIIESIEEGEQKVRGPQGFCRPTRELCRSDYAGAAGAPSSPEGLRIVTVYGGQPIERQIEALKRRPQIVVATPGRLLDHYNRRTVRLDAVRRVVLDECDEMLNMGFYKDVRKIIDRTPKERKLDLFSATLSREVLDISWLYQRDAEEILVERTEQSKPKIAQYYLESAGSQKVTDCERLIRQGQYGRVMIFCNTKHMADSLSQKLKKRGLPATACTATCARACATRSWEPSGRDGFRCSSPPTWRRAALTWTMWTP